MSKVTSTALHLVEAAVVSFAAFSVLLCLSHVPGVIRGPWGYGQTLPSKFVILFLNFVPTNWFCYLATPLVFGIVFRRKTDTSALSLRVVAVVILCFIGPAALVVSDLLSLHGIYAVEQPTASIFNTAINLMLLVVMGLSVVNDLWVQPKMRKRQNGGAESGNVDPNIA